MDGYRVNDFVPEINRLAKSTTLLAKMTTDPGVITTVPAQVTAAGVQKGANLGGLAYAEALSKDGPVVLISAAGSPPVITAPAPCRPWGLS